MTQRHMLLFSASGLALATVLARSHAARAVDASFPVTHTDAQWWQMLSPVQYQILRQQGTEAPKSSPLDHEFRPGRYDCVGCGHQLFSSPAQFDSGTGWPSFWQPLAGAVITAPDNSLFMTRTEVRCANCGGPLGHVFDDGPKPTGLRYCMNGAVLSFHLAATWSTSQ